MDFQVAQRFENTLSVYVMLDQDLDGIVLQDDEQRTVTVFNDEVPAPIVAPVMDAEIENSPDTLSNENVTPSTQPTAPSAPAEDSSLPSLSPSTDETVVPNTQNDVQSIDSSQQVDSDIVSMDTAGAECQQPASISSANLISMETETSVTSSDLCSISSNQSIRYV